MCLQMVTHNFMFDEYQMAAILDLGMKGTSHTSVDGTIVSGVPDNPINRHQNHPSTTLLSKVMCIFLFVIGAMAAILEKGHFLAYATNFGIPPRNLLKVVVFCT